MKISGNNEKKGNDRQRRQNGNQCETAPRPAAAFAWASVAENPAVRRAANVLLHCGAYVVMAVVAGVDFTVLLLPTLGLAILLIWVSVVDIERLEIPDIASLMIALGGCWQLFGQSRVVVIDAIAAALLWSAAFWLTARAYEKFRGWQGLGFGDVKLMAGLGLWLGLEGTTYCVLAASLSGILFLAGMHLFQLGNYATIATSRVAFGPFLCLSGWAVWLSGSKLL
ncbi:MAG: A24 family peptidase [Albidovulum sp.]|uniref:prepilin peptidase n=1 Tax=Albidovulum sp. TaxID=1872424 RepID=UPI003CB000E6